MKANRLSLLALFALPLLLPTDHAALADPPTASTPDKAVVDESAMALLKKVETTMIGLKTYQAECWTTRTYPPSPEGKPRPTAYEMSKLTAIKPNLMRYDGWTMTADDASQPWKKKSETPTYIFVSDGKTSWRQYGASYRQDKRVGPEYMSTILEPWGGFYLPSSSPYGNATYQIQQGEMRELRRDGNEVVEGVPCEKVFVHYKTSYNNQTQESHSTWYIDNKGLVRRKVETIEFGGKPGYTRDAVLRNIVTDAPVTGQKTLFAYTPPAGVKSEEQVERERPALLAKGVAAPDFTTLDRDGKSVKLSDFRGKVVVLDFWASWCGPCVASMPHNQEVAKKLQSQGIPVVLLAVDNSEERDPFLEWIKKRPELDAIQFVHADRKTTDIAGNLYKVTGIPTQYVIDAQGIVRYSTVGFGGPNEDLEKAVRAALSK